MKKSIIMILSMVAMAVTTFAQSKNDSVKTVKKDSVITLSLTRQECNTLFLAIQVLKGNTSVDRLTSDQAFSFSFLIQFQEKMIDKYRPTKQR